MLCHAKIHQHLTSFKNLQKEEKRREDKEEDQIVSGFPCRRYILSTSFNSITVIDDGVLLIIIIIIL